MHKINIILEEKNLHLHGQVQVRHLLDVVARDVGPAKIVSRVKNPFIDLNIAPYYGCQCLRPYSIFDDPEEPRSMEPLIEAVGAKVHPWNMGGRCCGASHMTTKPEVALELVAGILKAARGADAIVTVCPMCQMNLEAYQKKISAKVQRRYAHDHTLSSPVSWPCYGFIGTDFAIGSEFVHYQGIPG